MRTTRSMIWGLMTFALAGGARSASAQVLPIDDFTTGAGVFGLSSTGVRAATQAGTNILGGTRCEVLFVTANPLGRSAVVEVRTGADAYLAVDTGIDVFHGFYLLYGYDESCNAKGLNVDLSGYDRLRIQFEALDLDTAGGVVLFTDTGAAGVPLGVAAGQQAVGEVALADFTGVDLQHVQEIAFVIASGGVVAAHDYALRSVSAVRDAR